MISRLYTYTIKFIALILLSSQNYAAADALNLNLTTEEKQWLAAHPTVRFTGDPNWLPYEAFDAQGNYIGIVAEHLALISKMTGLTFIMSPSKTWTESTEKAKQGLVDMLSETDDSDLRSHLDFTIPYITNPIIIAMHSRENYVEKLIHIKNKKIALIKDYGYASKIRRKYPDIHFITVDNIQNGLVAVSTGEADALLCTLALCSYTISELGLNNVKITGKTEFDTKLAFGVQKNLPELASILNKAIKKITQKQQQLILDRWIRNKFANRTDYTLAIQISIIAIILLAIFIFWNRRLSREINLRIKIENELKSAEEISRLTNQRLLSHREHTPLGVIEWNTNFKVVDWNHAAEKIFGFTKEEMQVPDGTKKILTDKSLNVIDDIWKDLISNTGGTRSTNENITKDGRTILCEWYNTPLFDSHGKLTGVASLVDDITERNRSEMMIWKQANYDTLTGLPNRNMFYDRLTHELIKSDRDKQPLALLLIDLDQFKEVNDTLGHDLGDQLLKEATVRISDCVRHSDTVARLGGDEFTIILTELRDDSHIETVSQKIIDKLEEAFQLYGETVYISASIGISIYPDDAKDIETLIKNADQAMYAAKNKGRHCFSYFTQSLQDVAQNRLRLTNDLRKALDNEEFEVYYQPIINLKNNCIVKAEALIRWLHPDRGIVGPLEFIHLAEETGLINKIGNWVFKQSVQQSHNWSQQYSNDFQVSVNLSPIQFKIDTRLFISEWEDYIQTLGISGKNIVVEITEGLLLNAEHDVIEKLLWLRDAGIQVAIDDFGTGYSSLSYLKKFDIDYLKIDKAFINNLETSLNDRALCNAIIAMAHTLGLEVIAEGVETESQKQILKDAGCDFAQGYLFAKPVTKDAFEAILISNQDK